MSATANCASSAFFLFADYYRVWREARDFIQSWEPACESWESACEAVTTRDSFSSNSKRIVVFVVEWPGAKTAGLLGIVRVFVWDTEF